MGTLQTTSPRSAVIPGLDIYPDLNPAQQPAHGDVTSSRVSHGPSQECPSPWVTLALLGTPWWLLQPQQALLCSVPRLPLQGVSHEPLLCPEAVLEGQADQAGQGQDCRCGAAAEAPGEQQPGTPVLAVPMSPVGDGSTPLVMWFGVRREFQLCFPPCPLPSRCCVTLLMLLVQRCCGRGEELCEHSPAPWGAPGLSSASQGILRHPRILLSTPGHPRSPQGTPGHSSAPQGTPGHP